MTPSEGRERNIEAVVKRIIVRCGSNDAFRYFTSDFQKWWPAHTHSVIAMSSARRPSPVAVQFRAASGRPHRRAGAGGERYLWGTVIAWDPPRKVAFTWHPGRDARIAQTVEVTFSEAGDSTEVLLVHSGFERLAQEEASVTREGYDNGWEGVFKTAFGEYVGRQQA